jgi:CheY-like chemotaxis protein
MLSIGTPDAAPTAEIAAASALEQATARARSGDRAGARELLLRLVELEPANEAAWIWLATVAADGAQAIDALRAAHRLAPDRRRTQSALTKRLFREGVGAAQRGDRARAQALLQECATIEPGNTRTWLWLASTAPSSTEAVGHLRRALDLEPDHELARATLRGLLAHHHAGTRDGSAGTRSGEIVADPAALEAEALAEARAEVESQVEAVVDGEVDAGAGTAVGGGPGPALAEPAVARSSIAHTTRVAPRASVRTGILPGFDALTHDMIAIGGGSAPDSRLVMVINSSPAAQRSVAVALERYGHRVLPATDGEDALEKLARVEPDLILLDVAAAPADGYRLCRTLRAKIGRRGVPVVVSGGDGVVNRVRGWMAGATDSIAKPFAEPALINVVLRHAAAGN